MGRSGNTFQKTIQSYVGKALDDLTNIYNLIVFFNSPNAGMINMRTKVIYKGTVSYVRGEQ